MNQRRLGALALTTLLVGSTVATGVAQAQEGETVTTEVYQGRAEATALHLNLLGTDLTLSNVTSSVDSSPKAVGTADEILTPLFTNTGLNVTQSGEGTTKKESECTFDALEAIPGVARIVDVGCPFVTSSVVGGNPTSRSVGAELKLDVSVAQILETLGLDTPIAGDEDTGADDTIIDSLEPLVSALTALPEIGPLIGDAVTTVDNLLDDVLGLDTTVRIAVAPVKTLVTTTDQSVESKAIAQALRIELLALSTPFENDESEGIINDLGVGDPLITITIGEAVGSSFYNRATGTTSPGEATASVAKIQIGGEDLPLIDDQLIPLLETIGLGDILGQVTSGIQGIPGLEQASVSYEDRTITIVGPGTLTLLEGTPLETTIVLSDVSSSGDGFAGSGAQVHLLKGVNDGILVSLSDITGGNEGELTTTVNDVLDVVTTPVELARTGSTPWVALVGMLMLALALGGRRVLVSRD